MKSCWCLRALFFEETYFNSLMELGERVQSIALSRPRMKLHQHACSSNQRDKYKHLGGARAIAINPLSICCSTMPAYGPMHGGGNTFLHLRNGRG